jgi:hypothetical protein
MGRLLGIGSVGLVYFLLVNVAQAAEDPTGTWKWSGAMVGRNNTETAIEEGTFKENVVSFKVTRERNGQKFTTKYSGTVSGDEIKGKSESERDGQVQSRDWVAKRQK